MAHTLAAVFAQRDMAGHARQDLITAGFPSANIRLHDAGSDTGAAADEARRDDGDSLLDSVKHFFSDLFGSHADRHVYAEAVRRGHIVLTLEDASDADIQRATDIVERYAPIDIDAHAEHWRSGGWQGADVPLRDTAQRQGASMQSGAPSQQGASAGNLGEAPAASQQFAGGMPTTGTGSVRRYPGADNLPGASYDEEQYYRSHWSSQYAASGARFEDYDPAYRYGHSMAGSASYRGQSWEQVEPELRSNWEHTYPQSAWDDFKAAVRHGWERITS
ncbi:MULTISPECIES: hypothetical protein [unclassified Janthinobacterium]|uniref:hypothetical protein n=1 Tax=unclassified Janthinobacterium TaxID=2610881 RepID=UPI000890FEEE|nr:MULTISPECIES: hypothetical protein [unclassified Janthinobacterium]SDA68966.1 hypothetical protein SAMN03159349_03377 [Janthinobacterium sp. 551a]SFB51903.1 hypothetical protein SAMN03159300_106299 [Janthinobacterium sp. 344]